MSGGNRSTVSWAEIDTYIHKQTHIHTHTHTQTHKQTHIHTQTQRQQGDLRTPLYLFV